MSQTVLFLRLALENSSKSVNNVATPTFQIVAVPEKLELLQHENKMQLNKTEGTLPMCEDYRRVYQRNKRLELLDDSTPERGDRQRIR
ncbi:hypothetical protein AVEN_47410-1 [Araneus ventricosus]|uniref:Uncharacterized protein n=1 Tax=Araneus ventricosus TaxID=182803 RepID=A0A4Y2PEW0_ARAVE|nr:hypothetical protein AVEN_47410-1 [Araneus ventricosus]